MTQLGLTDVVNLCYARSNDPVRIGTAVAVIFAESGGRTDAKCENVRDLATGHVVCLAGETAAHGPIISTDRGLCQINDKAHPDVSDATAYDPAGAVGVMFRLSGGFVNFSPWVAYTNGSYKRFLDNAIAQARAVIAAGKPVSGLTQVLTDTGGALVGAGGVAASAAGGVVSAAEAVPRFLAALSNPQTWLRVAQVVLGIGSLAAGAFMLDRDLIGGAVGQAAMTAGHAAATAL